MLFFLFIVHLAVVVFANSACDCRSNTDTVEYYYKKISSNTLAACCDECQTDEKCGFLTFLHDICYLKNASTLTPTSKTGVTLCSVRTPFAPTPPPTPQPPTPTPKYKVELTQHSSKPVISQSNPVGHGKAPDGCISFNPSYIPSSPTFNQSGVLVRLCCGKQCTGHGVDKKLQLRVNNALPRERIGFAPCDLETGVCQDVLLDFNLDPSGSGSEDPRAFWYQGYYYNFYFHSGTKPKNCTGSQCTVKLAKTQTPLNATSWSEIQTYPWHRNGCCAMKPKGQRSYCIWGEGPSPFPGLGISYTTDIDQGVFTQVNWTVNSGVVSPLSKDGQWFLPLGSNKDEIKLEAGTHLMPLSSGDWLHFYAAATPGWVANGNYTAGYIILDQKDPSRIIQRSVTHIMIPTYDYETLCNGSPDCDYSGERKNVIFLCSATPMGGDRFRLFFGGGDGNVGTGIVQVTQN